MSVKITWEESVDKLRQDPKFNKDVLDNYFEKDIFNSCIRFHKSAEFVESMKLIPKSNGAKLLDIGAGRGIASYAFAKEGFAVTALEPDTSNDVGSGAIKQISEKFNLPIQVVEAFGEALPFESNSFDVVYARQVLHHARNLNQFIAEVQRVLKNGGLLLSTRDHVISDENQKELFLENHLLHKLYGGENAFTLSEYQNSLKMNHFKIIKQLGSYDSPINYFPLTKEDLTSRVKNKYTFIGNILCQNEFLLNLTLKLKSKMDNNPGRLVSFLAKKEL